MSQTKHYNIGFYSKPGSCIEELQFDLEETDFITMFNELIDLFNSATEFEPYMIDYIEEGEEN